MPLHSVSVYQQPHLTGVQAPSNILVVQQGLQHVLHYLPDFVLKLFH